MSIGIQRKHDFPRSFCAKGIRQRRVYHLQRALPSVSKININGPKTVPLTLIAIAARSYREEYIEVGKRFRQARQDEPFS